MSFRPRAWRRRWMSFCSDISRRSTGMNAWLCYVSQSSIINQSLLRVRTRVRARSIYKIIRMCVRNEKHVIKHIIPPFCPFCPKTLKITPIDFQWLMKKVHFFCIFFAKIFGGFKKLYYLCTRFWETNVFRFSTGGSGH